MKFKDLLITANSNIMQSKLRSTLTIGAIFVGALILTLSMGLSKGARDYMDFQLNGISVDQTLIVEKNNVQLSDIFSQKPKKYEEGKINVSDFSVSLLNKDDKEIIENKLNSFDFVEEVKPQYYIAPEYVEVEGQKYISTTSTYYERMKSDVAAGSFDNLEDDSIILGYGYYKSTNLDSPEDLVGRKVKVGMKNYNDEVKEFEFTVAGITSNSFAVNVETFINQNAIETLQEYATPDKLNREEVSEIFVFLDENVTDAQVDEVRSAIKELDYGVNTFDEQKAQFTSLISNIETGLIVFSMLLISVSVFGIANTLLMSVYERTREIGLMKALGMKNRKIFQLFALESTIIGVWGSILGVIFASGIGFVLNILANEFLSETYRAYDPYIIPFAQIPSIIIGICLVSLISGSIPAIKASKLDSIEALRHE
jgi:putative ABC transport system permease protein